MSIRVLFFSQLRDLCDCEELEVSLAEVGGSGTEPVTVKDLLEYLYGKFPGLQKWDARILIAADHEYVDRLADLQNGQEIAIMPPVQGG